MSQMEISSWDEPFSTVGGTQLSSEYLDPSDSIFTISPKQTYPQQSHLSNCHPMPLLLSKT